MRSRTGALLTLAGLGLVLVATFLPLVTYDVDGFGDASGVALDDSASGWGDGINDGPIHLIVALLPMAAAIVVLKQGGRTWAKVAIIVAAVIGFFWIMIRFADISGSLEENSDIGDLTAALTDPGIGLYLLCVGWGAVLVAGLIVPGSGKASPAVPTTF